MQKIFIALAFILLICLVLAAPTMLLWNWLMPEIFGLIELDFWQALGLTLLSNILFKDNNSNTKDE